VTLKNKSKDKSKDEDKNKSNNKDNCPTLATTARMGHPAVPTSAEDRSDMGAYAASLTSRVLAEKLDGLLFLRLFDFALWCVFVCHAESLTQFCKSAASRVGKTPTLGQLWVTLRGICFTNYIGVLRLRCAPLRMTLKNNNQYKIIDN
jgi:hypothetical protein